MSDSPSESEAVQGSRQAQLRPLLLGKVNFYSAAIFRGIRDHSKPRRPASALPLGTSTVSSIKKCIPFLFRGYGFILPSFYWVHFPSKDTG